jgi:hypothetical protein
VANTFKPFGFSPYDPRSGTVTNFGLTARKIRSGNDTKMYRGDPVNLGTSSDAGYIVQGAGGTTVPSLGVFWGAHLNSSTLKVPFDTPYWPGSGAAADALGYVINAPNMLFLVQSGNSSGSATPVAASQVGLGADYAIGTGSTVNGFSGAYLDVTTIATPTATLPFRIVALASDYLAPGAPGADSTTAYNYVIVEYNPVLLPA